MRVVDLGCGTGELTLELHRALGAAETLGIDSSAAMLAKSAGFAGGGLRFAAGRIEDFPPAGAAWDLIFANASLQWVAGHPALIARLAAALAPDGQLAVQVPANHGHASHLAAGEVAREAPFAEALGGFVRQHDVLTPEGYAELLHGLGFVDPHVRLQVYGHVLPGRDDVVEWVRGTLLTAYEQRLAPELFARFLERYRERLRALLPDTRPFFYPFQRILFRACRSR